MSRRARSAASRMRAREARTSASCASVTSCSRSACSAARRAVMSKIAPSSHQRPSPACCACPRSSTQRTEPSRCTIRYSSANGRPVATDSMTDSRDVLVVVGMLDARERAHRVVDEVARRVARDLLDLVAQPLHRPVAGRTRSGRWRRGCCRRASAASTRWPAAARRAARSRRAPRAPRGSNGMRITSSAPASSASRSPSGESRSTQTTTCTAASSGSARTASISAGPCRASARTICARAVVDHARPPRRVSATRSSSRPGVLEHRQGVVAELLQPEQQHAVAVADEPVEGARRPPFEPRPGPSP